MGLGDEVPTEDDQHASNRDEDENVSFGEKKKRNIAALEPDTYNFMVQHLKGKHIPKRDRSNNEESAIKKINRYNISVGMIYDPTVEREKEHLICEGKILPRKEDIDDIISFFVHKTHDSGIHNLLAKIGDYYIGTRWWI